MVPGKQCWIFGPSDAKIRLRSPSVALLVGRLGGAKDGRAELIGQY